MRGLQGVLVDLPVLHDEAHRLDFASLAVGRVEQLGIAPNHGDVFQGVAIDED